MIVKFEDIISNPEIEIKNIANYSNLSFNPDDLGRKVKDTDPSRSYAYRKNPNLLKFESSHYQLIKKMGYSS